MMKIFKTAEEVMDNDIVRSHIKFIFEYHKQYKELEKVVIANMVEGSEVNEIDGSLFIRGYYFNEAKVIKEVLSDGLPELLSDIEVDNEINREFRLDDSEIESLIDFALEEFYDEYDKVLNSAVDSNIDDVIDMKKEGE